MQIAPPESQGTPEARLDQSVALAFGWQLWQGFALLILLIPVTLIAGCEAGATLLPT